MPPVLPPPLGGGIGAQARPAGGRRRCRDGIRSSRGRGSGLPALPARAAQRCCCSHRRRDGLRRRGELGNASGESALGGGDLLFGPASSVWAVAMQVGDSRCRAARWRCQFDTALRASCNASSRRQLLVQELERLAGFATVAAKFCSTNRSIRPWTVAAAVRAFWALEKPEMFDVALISKAPSGWAVMVMRCAGRKRRRPCRGRWRRGC